MDSACPNAFSTAPLAIRGRELQQIKARNHDRVREFSPGWRAPNIHESRTTPYQWILRNSAGLLRQRTLPRPQFPGNEGKAEECADRRSGESWSQRSAPVAFGPRAA